jgi:hypothetical protein
MVTKWSLDTSKSRNEHIHQIVRDHFRISQVFFEDINRSRALFLAQRASARAIRARNRAQKDVLSDADIREAERDAREESFDSLLGEDQIPDQGQIDQEDIDHQEFEEDFIADQRQREEDEAMSRPAWSGQIPFIFISEETSGISTREVRSWGPAPTRYSIVNIHIQPFDIPSKYHKLAIVLTNYPHETDATFPTGAPIFLNTAAGTGIPDSEKEDKMRWPDSPVDIPGALVPLKQGDYICVVNEYESPAVAMIDGQIVITIEDAGSFAILKVGPPPDRILPSPNPRLPPIVRRPARVTTRIQAFSGPYGAGYRSWYMPVGRLRIGREFFDITPETPWNDIPMGATVRSGSGSEMTLMKPSRLDFMGITPRT